MNPGTRAALLVLGGLWIPIGLRAGIALARANGLAILSGAGLTVILLALLAFGTPWLVAALAARFLPGRAALLVASGLLLVPLWGVVRWMNVALLPERSDPLSVLGNMGLLLALVTAGAVITALAFILGELLQARAPSRRGKPAGGPLLVFALLLWGCAFWFAGRIVPAPHRGEPQDAVAPAAAGTTAVPGASSGAERPGSRVCVIGVDGATWDLMTPLLAAGELPVIRAMMTRGHFGTLATLQPWSASPVLWTTLATGKLPASHGIQFFVADIHRLPFTNTWITVPPTWTAPVIAPALALEERAGLGRRERVPVNGSMRQAPALWEIASRQGARSLVVNWWATWPAEPIQGVMSSDMTDLMHARLLGVAEREQGMSFLDSIPRLVHPPEYTGRVLQLIREVAVPAPWRDGAFGIRVDADPARVASTPLDPNRPGTYLQHAILSDAATLAIASHFLQDGSGYDLTCIYFRGLDWVEHYLWDAMEPEFFPDTSPGARTPELAGAIPAYYRYVDWLLGEVRHVMGEDVIILVVSDHGHVKALPPGVDGNHRGTHDLWPRPDGILLADGPGLRTGARPAVRGARLQDIAPTALYLLGSPVPRDLDGRVIEDLPGPDRLRRHPVEWSPPVARLEVGALRGAPGGMDDAGLERLRSLGYLQ